MFEIASYTAPGEGSENEDAYEIQPHPSNTELNICALADGQGGREGAATAAHTACRSLIQTVADCRPPATLTRAQNWEPMMRRTDQAVLNDPAAGFTTLVAFCITPSCICGASSGDSAALLVNGGQVAEVLTAGQAKNPPVGSGNARFGSFYAELSSPWTLITMSDGVWKYTGWDPIRRIAARHANGQSIIDLLRDYATAPYSGQLQDDFTLVVIQNAVTDGGHAKR